MKILKKRATIMPGSCNGTAQPIRDENCPQLTSELIREEPDSITELRVDMSRERSAVKRSECENVAKKSRISVRLEK